MTTNRLRFINVDESASIAQASAITGFTVVKAPRGTTVPQFFAKGNTNALLQWLGAPSSTYPGIQEVIDFNQLYGLWVSAPAGSVTAPANTANALPSYFGGVYVTTLASLEPFYGVVEDMSGSPVINNFALMTAGNLQSPFTNTTIAESYGSNKITADQINSNFFTYSKVKYIILTYPRSDGTTAKVIMTLNVGTQELHVANPTGGADLTVGIVSASSYLTGYLKIDISGGTYQSACNSYLNGTYYDLKTTDVDLNPWLTANVANIVIQWVYDITSYVILPISQTSPRQYAGTFSLTSVDTRQNLHSSVQTDYTIAGSSGTAGTVILCGQPVLVTGGGVIDTAAHVATFLAAQVISGYTLSTPGSTNILRVVTTSQTVADPSIVIPPVGIATPGLVGFTFTGVNTFGAAIINPNYNTMSFSYTETYYGSYTYTKNYYISTDTLKTDGYGQGIYAEDVLTGDAFIRAEVPLQQFYNTISSISIPPTGSYTIVWNPMTITLYGTRAVVNSAFSDSTSLDGTMALGWNLAGNVDYQNTQIFFDSYASPATATLFANLRTASFPFSTFITGIKVANGIPTSQSDLTAAVAAIVSARASLPNITGLAYYCNEFLVKEIYTGTSYWGQPIGSVAGMLAQIMEQRLGGVAPMFVNENSLGGQISKTVRRQKYNFDATSLDTLDAAGVNPIILDPFYGLMITSQKTAQSPINLTDWSFLGHQMSFDLFRAELKQSVMLPQIGKLIDTYHMALRHSQAQAILNKRLSGPTAIWADGAVFVEDINTPETKAQNNFMIKVRVKVSPFSEYVTLTFINVGQTSSVT
jgi:hypothetical protein